MRFPISVSVAVLLATGLSFECEGEEPSTAVPKEWRVEVRVQNCPFEAHTARMPSRVIELKSNGEVTDFFEPFRAEPKKTTKKTVRPDFALAGLHLIWSALEDVPLCGGVVSDGDRCHLLIETKSWMWKRSWVAGGQSTKPAEQAIVTFEKLIHKNTIDPASFRTRHRTPTEMRARWMTESQRPDQFVGWNGTASSGDSSFAFAKSFVKYGTLVDFFTDLRDRSVDRNTTGDKNVEITFKSGGGDHITSIQIKGLKDFSEAGERIETIIRWVHDRHTP